MKEMARSLRSDGLSWTQVAKEIGVSYQSVYCAVEYYEHKNPEGKARFVEKTTGELESRGFEITQRHGIVYVKDMRWAFQGRSRKELHDDEWMIRADERLDLIRGLIDSDGTRKSNSSVALTQSGYRMRTVLDPAVDAMRSMGWTVGKPYCKPTDREPAATTTISPTITDCSMLPRKHIGEVKPGSRYRGIVDIYPEGVHPVRCIEVHSDEHLYLSGKGLVPTHNSLRAEPVAALYEKGRIFHVRPFPELEDEMLSFVPDDLKRMRSPNRVDALVYALTELFLGGGNYSPPMGGGSRPQIVVPSFRDHAAPSPRFSR
jgi:hypothetical protein